MVAGAGAVAAVSRARPVSRDPVHAHSAQADLPWLSVLVPAYNVAPYVEAAIASVLSAPDAGIEVVVYDDGSTDDTRSRADRLAATDARLRVVGEPANRGASHARNRLLDAARGSYVWFLDADDRLLPGAVESLRRAVRGCPDLVMCDFRVQAGLRRWRTIRRTFDGPAEGGGNVDALLAGALRAGQLHAWSKIARRGLWDGVRFPECRRFEDIAPSLALLARANSWRHVGEPWVAYRQRAGSLMRTLGAEDLRDYSAALAHVRRIASSPAPDRGTSGLASAAEAYLLRGHASIARRLAAMRVPTQAPVARHCRARFQEDFPDRARHALADARARRGLWHARRLGRSLDRASWRDD